MATIGEKSKERDRLDALMHLQRIQFDRFQARKIWEWRLTFTFWGGLVLAANALRGVDLPLTVYWLGVMAVTVLHAIWENVYIRAGAEPNREYGAIIGREIGDMVGFAPINPDTNERYEWVGEYKPWAAHYWQVGVTFVLVLVVGAVVYW